MDVLNSTECYDNKIEIKIEETNDFTPFSHNDLENVCRVCLSSNKTLVSLQCKEHDSEICLKDMLKVFIPTQVSAEMTFPKEICVQCQNELIISYNFKVKCERSDNFFNSVIQCQSSLPSTMESSKETKDKTVGNNINYKITKAIHSDEETEVQYLDEFDDSENDSTAVCIVQESKNSKELNVTITDSQAFLEKTVRVNARLNQTVYNCNICSKNFKKLKRLKAHLQLNHNESENQSNRCGQCKEIFTCQSDLELHSAIHQSGPWECKVCSKGFKTKAMFRRHLQRHMESKRFKCEVCQKSFTELYALRRHARVHTGEKIEKKRACSICDKRFVSNYELEVHKRRHTGARPFACVICDRTFGSARLLASHAQVHSDRKPYACEYCDRRFRHESTRNTHHRTHTGEKPYVCATCGKTFIQNSNLRLHIRTHTGEKPYSCDKCEKKFTSGSALKIHMRVHTGEKPYGCDVCGKRFARMDLGAHMRMHSGERPHACSACPKTFVNAARLREHRRVHTGEKPFECATCTQSFGTKTHLIKHIKTHQLRKNTDRRAYYFVRQIESSQLLKINEKPTKPQTQITETFNKYNKDIYYKLNQNVENMINHHTIIKNSTLNLSNKVPLHVIGEIILQDEEVLVVDNSQKPE